MSITSYATDVRPEQIQTETIAFDFDRLTQGDPQRARPTDPWTSHMAAAGLTEADLQDSQAFVLRHLVECGKSPAWRIERQAFGEWSGSRIRTALVELEAEKLIRRSKATGRNARGTRYVDEFEVIR